MPEIPERKFSPQQEQAFSLVAEHVGQLELSGVFKETVYSALRLYGYNFFTLHQNPTEDDLLTFRNHCLQINEREESAAAPFNPLCTIGGELEAFYTPATRAVLDQLHIPLVKEEDPSNRLWEVMFPWSYSADTQITMLHELIKMSAVNSIAGLGEGLPGQDRRRMALHLNYSMPEELQDYFFVHSGILGRLYDVNDALILGYTSPNRISEMPMTTVTYDKEAERTPKTSGTIDDPDSMVFRVELRGLEFTEPLTYALLRDSQRLMTAYFAWVMSHFKVPTQQEASLISVFTRFDQQFTAMRDTYQIPPNFTHGLDDQKEYAIGLVQNPKVPPQVRQLVSQASAEVDQVLSAA